MSGNADSDDGKGEDSDEDEAQEPTEDGDFLADFPDETDVSVITR